MVSQTALRERYPIQYTNVTAKRNSFFKLKTLAKWRRTNKGVFVHKLEVIESNCIMTGGGHAP